MKALLCFCLIIEASADLSQSPGASSFKDTTRKISVHAGDF